MKIEQHHIDSATHTVMFAVAQTFSRFIGTNEFRPGEAIGYGVQNRSTGNIVVVTNDEAAKLAVQRYTDFQEGNTDSPLFFDNAIAQVINHRSREHTTLIGFNGLRPYDEEHVADLTGIRRWSYENYTNEDTQKKAYQLALDILRGTYTVSDAMSEKLKQWRQRELQKLGYNT
jgi:hypothetical protein